MSKEQNETIIRINKTFGYNVQLIEELKDHSIEAAIVFSVSLMETILCEYFYFSKYRWFDYCRIPGEIPIPILNTPSARVQLRKYLKNNRLMDEFFELRYIYDQTSNPDLLALDELLRKKINFQNLDQKDARSATTAYKIFLDIDLKRCLNPKQEKSREQWNILKKMVDARHRIIHRGITSDISLSDVDSVLISLKYLKNNLERKLCVVITNP